MGSIIYLLAVILLGTMAYRYYKPLYRTMADLVVERSRQLLQEGCPAVYLLQPQERNVIRKGAQVPSMARFAPWLGFVIAYTRDGKLVLETVAWKKLFLWGTWTSAQIPAPNPGRRSIRIGAYTYLVLSTDPIEFPRIMWSADLPPQEAALEYRQQLYDDIRSHT